MIQDPDRVLQSLRQQAQICQGLSLLLGALKARPRGGEIRSAPFPPCGENGAFLLRPSSPLMGLALLGPMGLAGYSEIYSLGTLIKAWPGSISSRMTLMMSGEGPSNSWARDTSTSKPVFSCTISGEEKG